MNSPVVSPSERPTPDRPVRLGRFAWIAIGLIALGLVAGFIPRIDAEKALKQEAIQNPPLPVSVVTPSPTKASRGVPLSAEIKPFMEASIYARASGYLKRWVVDIGDHVKSGDLLAEIDAPELDQQIAQAKAETAQAEASLELSQTTANRWAELLKTSSVSEQEAAEKKADLALKAANVDAAKANLRRLEDLARFCKVTAPFDGVITVRHADVGQLITAGSGVELFHLIQTNPLRVYVKVPQSSARSIKTGAKGELLLQELPGRKFEATVTRTANAIQTDSRTLLVELQVDNSKGEILAGSFAQLSFVNPAPLATLTLPASTLLFRSEGVQIGAVSSNGAVSLRTLKLGRDFGQAMEVLDGITATDRIIVNPPDLLTNGQIVRVIDSADKNPSK
jgi:RND family efflux transporter MFP subunit